MKHIPCEYIYYHKREETQLRFNQLLNICYLSSCIPGTSELLPHFNLTIIVLFRVQYSLMIIAGTVYWELLCARQMLNTVYEWSIIRGESCPPRPCRAEGKTIRYSCTLKAHKRAEALRLTLWTRGLQTECKRERSGQGGGDSGQAEDSPNGTGQARLVRQAGPEQSPDGQGGRGETEEGNVDARQKQNRHKVKEAG